MSNYPLLNAIGKTSQNILWEVSNSVLIGIPEGIKKTFHDIHHNSKLSNEALYCLQVKTFLETADLSEDEVNNFMNDNPDHLRLGLEIFKILENTVIDKQARMLAKAFKLYATDILSRAKFDKYTYIVTNINQHFIRQIIELYDLYKQNIDFEGGSAVPFLNMEFISFGFIERRFEPTFGDAEDLLNFKDHEYLVLQFFIDFYENIFKD